MHCELDKAAITEFFIKSRTPPWRPITSRALAKVLGVSLQSLANWRVRECGPEAEPWKKGKGNRTFYRPDKVLSWIGDGQQEPWEFCRLWLQNRGLEVVGGLDRGSTAWMIEGLDDQL